MITLHRFLIILILATGLAVFVGCTKKEEVSLSKPDIITESDVYDPTQMISLSHSDKSVKLYYTVNTAMTEEYRTLYTAPFSIAATRDATVRAIAVRNGLFKTRVSPIVSRYFSNTLPAPTISSNDTNEIKITHTDREAAIMYSIGFSSFSDDYTTYTKPFTITKKAWIRAYAKKDKWFDSNTATYSVSRPYTLSKLKNTVTKDQYIKAENFGASLDVSADGQTAAVGAPGVDYQDGAVYIYRKNGDGWIRKWKIKGNNETHQLHFGKSLSLSDSGKRIAVSVRNNDDGTWQIFQYSLSGNDWSGSMLDMSTLKGYQFYDSTLSMSGNGNTIVANGIDTQDNAFVQIVFFRTEKTWKPSFIKLRDRSVDMKHWTNYVSSNGNTIISSYNGSVRIFAKETNKTIFNEEIEWIEESFTVPEQATRHFGCSIDLSSDDSKLLVGDIGSDNNTGSVYLFTATDSGWKQDYLFSPSTLGYKKEYFLYGYSVSISDDGRKILIGSPGSNNKLFYYHLAQNSWKHTELEFLQSDYADDTTKSQLQYLNKDKNEQSSLPGYRVCISANGSTALFTGPSYIMAAYSDEYFESYRQEYNTLMEEFEECRKEDDNCESPDIGEGAFYFLLGGVYSHDLQ